MQQPGDQERARLLLLEREQHHRPLEQLVRLQPPREQVQLQVQPLGRRWLRVQNQKLRLWKQGQRLKVIRGHINLHIKFDAGMGRMHR